MRSSPPVVSIFLLWTTTGVSGFSAPDPTFNLFDRFRPSCPADPKSIERFDPTLINTDNDGNSDAIWAAVFRSSNNAPSVFVRDEFMNVMKLATGVSNEPEKTSSPPEGIETTNNSVMEASETPVAIARLRPSDDFENRFVLDKMQCILKKENTDENCDGGSEHCEAIAVAIDAILLHHLSNNKDAPFDGAIRTKATLVSGSLLEDRGFEEVATLSRDMATHTSSLDACLCKYADRAVTTSARSPGARERAIQITSLLGTIDRTNDLKSNATEEEAASNDEDDPWAGIKQFI